MKKEITFEGDYLQDSKAIEWLSNLEKCFMIKKASIKSYTKETKYTKKHATKVIVEYD